MFSLMLCVKNDREQQVLRQAFEQQQIKVFVANASYSNFLKMLQYVPDAVIFELPRICQDEVHFAEMVKKHKRIKSIPLIAYGDTLAEDIKRGIVSKGFLLYIVRPLKFTTLMKFVQDIAKQKNKTLEPEKKVSDDRAADIQTILSPDTLPMAKIELMVKHIAKFLAFPFTVSKVLNLAENEKSGAQDLAKVIEADPVISANMLKVSNTVFFASLGRRIGSIKEAIIRIGFKETKRIVMSFAVMSLFSKEDKSLGFDRMAYWYHSLACGIIAEKIAKQMKGVSTEEAFLAGLLHDFGVIVLDEFFPEVFEKVLAQSTTDGSFFIDSEKSLLQIHHNDVITELFKLWKMPENIIGGMTGHYDFETLRINPDTPGKKLALCVALGDILAKSLVLGRECDQVVSRIHNEFLTSVKLTVGFTNDFIESVYRDVELYRQFLKLDEAEFTKRTVTPLDTEQKHCALVNMSGDVFVPERLFLEREGFEIEYFTTVDVTTMDSKFETVLVYGDESTTLEIVNLFVNIVARAPDGSSADAAPQFVKVVAMLPGVSPLHQEKPAGITILQQDIDLRRVEAAILHNPNQNRSAPAQ